MIDQSSQKTATDECVVLLPVRCAQNAELKGFEVLACHQPSLGTSSRKTTVKAHAPVSMQHVLEVLVGEASLLLAGHRLKLWIPVSLDALRQDDGAGQLLDGMAATPLPATDITFVLNARDVAGGSPMSNKDVLGAIASYRAGLALSAPADLDAIAPLARAGARISEVRLHATAFGTGREQPLAETVRRLHRSALLVSAIGVSEPEQIHQSIMSGVDLIQGDLVGRAHSVDAMVRQMISALPFGRTTL